MKTFFIAAMRVIVVWALKYEHHYLYWLLCTPSRSQHLCNFFFFGVQLGLKNHFKL